MAHERALFLRETILDEQSKGRDTLGSRLTTSTQRKEGEGVCSLIERHIRREAQIGQEGDEAERKVFGELQDCLDGH